MRYESKGGISWGIEGINWICAGTNVPAEMVQIFADNVRRKYATSLQRKHSINTHARASTGHMHGRHTPRSAGGVAECSTNMRPIMLISRSYLHVPRRAIPFKWLRGCPLTPCNPFPRGWGCSVCPLSPPLLATCGASAVTWHCRSWVPHSILPRRMRRAGGFGPRTCTMHSIYRLRPLIRVRRVVLWGMR